MKTTVFIFNNDSTLDDIPESFISDDLNSIRTYLINNGVKNLEFDDGIVTFNHDELYTDTGGATYYELEYVS
jgi:hypothetical protein